jgi:hypothetical protein
MDQGRRTTPGPDGAGSSTVGAPNPSPEAAMTRYPWILPLALALAACGGSEAGDDPDGGGGTGGSGPGCTQAQCRGTTSDYWEVDQVCVEGECQEVGLKDEFNETRRGSMLVGVKTHGVDARNFHSAHLQIFYPQDARGEAVDCARLLATPNRYHREFNLVGYYSTKVNPEGLRDLNTIFGPVAKLPVNDPSVPYVVYVGLFSGKRDPSTSRPTGVLLAEGCQAGMVVAEGEPESLVNPDPPHTFSVNAGPVAEE